MEWQTTFWSDFSIADVFGKGAVEDTYKRAFKEWRNDKVYVTELVIVLNHKISQHYEKNVALARVYDRLWKEAQDWCFKNLKGDDLKYFIKKID